MLHTYRTIDLAPEERVALERLLGRPLQPDEGVEVIAHRIPESEALEFERRKSAARRILELAKGKSLGGLSVRELIDEGRRF
jgi:hypothetical protein